MTDVMAVPVAARGGNGAHMPGAPTPFSPAPSPALPALRRTPGVFDAALIERARVAVEETVRPLRLIALDLDVSTGSLSRLALEMDWTRPPGAPRSPPVAARGRRKLAQSLADAGAVTGRLLRATDRQLAKVETRLRRPGTTIEEKDARILGHLARTLATLMTLQNGGSANTPEPVDRAQLNAELLRRITRWAEGGEEPL
jgi:hypothetical protein